MATFVKGDAVENATSYELLEKTAEGVYNSLKEASNINFDLSEIDFEPGDHTLVVKAKADGYETSDPSNEVVYSVEEYEYEGEWLSVLLTGDENAHNNFMNANLTGASTLGPGYDVIYVKPEIQTLLEGKKIYKMAANGLGENTVTLYSNPYVGNTTTNVPDGRVEIGTVTSASDQAAGTITEYRVNNPSAIKNGETLSVGWSARTTGITSVEGYITPVYYLSDGAFKTSLGAFCSFDFFVGE